MFMNYYRDLDVVIIQYILKEDKVWGAHPNAGNASISYGDILFKHY